MQKSINLFSSARNITTLPHSYVPKSLDLRVTACFAVAMAFLMVLYWQSRNSASKPLPPETPSFSSSPLSPSETLYPSSKAINCWTVNSSADRIIASFSRDLDPNTGQEIWISPFFSLKEGEFSLSIQHEQASKEFSIFLQCINSHAEVQAIYQYTQEGHEISGETILGASQVESQHLLGTITLNTSRKPLMVPLMVILKSLAQS